MERNLCLVIKLIIMEKKKFKLVGVSGTFSPPLHLGHETLIKKAFEISEKVMIGITIDEMTKHKTLVNLIPTLKIRKENVINFLKEIGCSERAIIIDLKDSYGPAIEDQGLEAIIVSEDTLYMGEKINQKREEKNLHPLEFVPISMVLSKNGKPISSTRMRKKEIDEKGNLI